LALPPHYLATAVEAALQAGRIHRQYFRRRPHIEKKGPIDLVTAADLETERQFRRLIGERYPSHVVLGEEESQGSGPRAGRARWIIDPVDGTTNFAHGLAFFCVSIALEIDGRIEIGVVYDPMDEELFTAERGGGARLNGAPISVTRETTLGDAVLCTGFPYSIRHDREMQVRVFGEFLGSARAVRRLGSAALDLCYVAAGRFDAFYEEHLHAWDMMAGLLIVEEAGGITTRFDATPVDPFKGQVVATNDALLPPILDVIRRVYGPEP
jgi:myo-inositol-1(or 4)-monophosphatase